MGNRLLFGRPLEETVISLATIRLFARAQTQQNPGSEPKLFDISNSRNMMGWEMTGDLDLGGKLRHLREQAGLSQRALAKRAKVTNSTISLIEANRANPSIGQLRRILDAIPIGLAEFFALEAGTGDGPFFRADDLMEIGKGPISFRQVGRSLPARQIQILSECYQPGADTGRILLQHDSEEGGVIISGQLEVTVNGERRVLGAGDAYYFDSRLPHRFRCVSDDPARVISACTPPSF